MDRKYSGYMWSIITYARTTYGILMYSERGVYVEVRGHGPLAPPEVHHAEGRVALRGQRLRTHGPWARRARLAIAASEYRQTHHKRGAGGEFPRGARPAGGTDAGKVRAWLSPHQVKMRTFPAPAPPRLLRCFLCFKAYYRLPSHSDAFNTTYNIALY